MPITRSFTANENISTDFTSRTEMLISCPPILPPFLPLKKGLWPSRSITDQPFGCSHLTMNYLQLGKGGMVPASGLSHINGLAGFGPGVLNPAGKTPISVLALQPARWSSGLVRNWPRIWVANKKIRPPTSLRICSWPFYNELQIYNWNQQNAQNMANSHAS